MPLASLLNLPAASALDLAQTCFRADPSELGGSKTHRREQMERIPRLIQAVVESAEEAHFDSACFIGVGDLSLKVESLLCPPEARLRDVASQQCGVKLKQMSCFQDKTLRSISLRRSCI